MSESGREFMAAVERKQRLDREIMDRLQLAHAELYDLPRSFNFESACRHAEIARGYIAELIDALSAGSEGN